MLERETVPVLSHQGIQRIVIVRALHLGDLLLAVPAFRALRRAFPDAEITLIGLPWVEPFVARFSRYLDRYVEFVGYPGLREVEIVPRRVQDFLREQQAQGYDLAIQMHGSGKSSLAFTLDLHARLTAGYYEGHRPTGLAVGAPYPDDAPEVLRNLGIARLLGCPDGDTRLELPLMEADWREARPVLDLLASLPRPWIGLHSGASAPSRRWPVEYFARVGDALVRGHGGTVVLTGGPGETSIARRVALHMEENSISASGRTSLGALSALISELDLFISNDTGPAHIAAALETPSITVFGPADHHRWAPLDAERHPIVRRSVPCSPCSYGECPIDHRCMRRVLPGTVVDKAAELLAAEVVACSA